MLLLSISTCPEGVFTSTVRLSSRARMFLVAGSSPVLARSSGIAGARSGRLYRRNFIDEEQASREQGTPTITISLPGVQ